MSARICCINRGEDCSLVSQCFRASFDEKPVYGSLVLVEDESQFTGGKLFQEGGILELCAVCVWELQVLVCRIHVALRLVLGSQGGRNGRPLRTSIYTRADTRHLSRSTRITVAHVGQNEVRATVRGCWRVLRVMPYVRTYMSVVNTTTAVPV